SSASFTFYFISTSTSLPDYASLGIDPNAVYIGANMYAGGSSFTGSNGYVIRKTSVLSGGPIVSTAFANIGTAATDGPFAPRGVDQDNPAATEGYFIGAGVTT